MLATRIKKRPYSFASWLLSILLLSGVVASFFIGISYWNSGHPFIFVAGAIWTGGAVSHGVDFIKPDQVLKDSQSEQLRLSLRTPQNISGALVVPVALPTLVLLSISSLVFWWRLSRPLGHCRSCGYNLIGNISGTCPECGTKTK